MMLALPWVFIRISAQTATFAVYIINWLVFTTVVESVYSAVRTDPLYKAHYVSSWKSWPEIQIRCVKLLYDRDKILDSVEWSYLVISYYMDIFWEGLMEIRKIFKENCLHSGWDINTSHPGKSQKHYIMNLLDRRTLIKQSTILSEGASQKQIHNLRNTILYAEFQTIFRQRYFTFIRLHCAGWAALKSVTVNLSFPKNLMKKNVFHK